MRAGLTLGESTNEDGLSLIALTVIEEDGKRSQVLLSDFEALAAANAMNELVKERNCELD